jgi:DNA-binding IclR family transcriptional regulator
MIQSVDRAIRILIALKDERLLGVSELADRLGLAKGTIHGLLKTLANRAMVVRDPASGKYTLGPAVLAMGNVYLSTHDLRARSLRWVSSLGDGTGLAVRLGVLVWPQVIVITHRPAAATDIPLSEVGLGMPAHATCLGKAILAFRVDRDQLVGTGTLSALTGQTLTNPAKLNTELEEVVDSGIAFERQEAVVGEGGVAGAIFGADGTVLGSVSAVYPVVDDDDPPHGVVGMVRDTARAISREMGASGWPVRF